MQLSERQAGAATILEIAGDIRADAGAPALNAAIRRLIQAGRTALVLNVSGAGSVDSAGLGALVQAHVSASRAGGSVRLVGTPKRLRELLVITKLASVLPSFERESDALAGFGGN